MSDELLLTILKWFGAADALAVLAAIGLFAVWVAIERAMDIADFMPLFIKWRYAEWEKSRGKISTKKPGQEGKGT